MALKPGYKRTAVGVIPVDWEMRHLGDLGDVVRGGSPRPAGDSRYFNGSYIPWLTVASLTNIPESQLFVTETSSYLTKEGATRSRTLKSGTLAIVNSGAKTLGVSKILSIDCCANDGIAALINQHAGDKRFLCHFLNSQTKHLRESVAAGNDQLNLNTERIAQIPVPFPPEAEQTAIAAAVSDVDALLEALTHIIEKRRDLKQAAMQQLLTGQTRLPGFYGEWEAKKIGDFTDCTAGGTPSTLVSSYWGGAIRWMSSGELNLKLVYEVNGRITESGLHNSSAVMLPAKCVLIGLAGQGKTRGTAALNLVELSTNQSIAAILPNAAFVPEYLYYNLDSRYDELREMSTATGGRGALNLSIIKAIDIRLPPLAEQAAIAAVLSDMDAELSALENRRDKTRALKQAMMQELLTGRTRLIAPVVTESRKDSERTDGRQANIHFKRTVLAAEIIDRLHDEPTFGHVKFEKMMFLVEHLCDVDTGSTYHRDAAGPYDNRAIRSIDSQLRKQKWFDARKGDDRYRYEPLANRGKHKGYFERYFGEIATTFDTVIETFRSFTTERCEIVATLFGAWRDLLQQNDLVSDDAIVNEVLNNWHKSKQRIPAERWRKALSWMRDHGFVPRKANGA